MKKGNLYKTKEGIVTICTKVLSSKYFRGTVLYSPTQRDVRGVISDYFSIDLYTEFIGDLTLNNVMNER